MSAFILNSPVTRTHSLGQSVNHWKKFYAEHKDYVKIGRVSHPPIDPASSIPEHCDPKKEAAAQAARKAAKERKSVRSEHREL